MPPVRSKKTRYRLELYDRVNRVGVEMSPCSRCAKRDLRCVVGPDSTRCSECIKAGGGVKCDVHGPSSEDWGALEREERKLADALDAAEIEHQKHLDGLQETQNRLRRLRKQREAFQVRAAMMLRRGLKTLDELDAAEAQEKEDVSSLLEAEPLDPGLAAALETFDATDPFWSTFVLPSAAAADPSSHDWGAVSGTHPIVPNN
jgi:hypothetical protein